MPHDRRPLTFAVRDVADHSKHACFQQEWSGQRLLARSTYDGDPTLPAPATTRQEPGNRPHPAATVRIDPRRILHHKLRAENLPPVSVRNAKPEGVQQESQLWPTRPDQSVFVSAVASPPGPVRPRRRHRDRRRGPTHIRRRGQRHLRGPVTPGTPRRLHRPCHWRAISDGQSRYRAGVIRGCSSQLTQSCLEGRLCIN
jgi:hypothetical protein